VRDDYPTKSVGYRSKRSKEHPYYTLVPVGHSVRWWSGVWIKCGKLMIKIVVFCLVVSVLVLIFVFTSSVFDDDNNPLVVEDIKH
jgi:hypothetical protein